MTRNDAIDTIEDLVRRREQAIKMALDIAQSITGVEPLSNNTSAVLGQLCALEAGSLQGSIALCERLDKLDEAVRGLSGKLEYVTDLLEHRTQ